MFTGDHAAPTTPLPISTSTTWPPRRTTPAPAHDAATDAPPPETQHGHEAQQPHEDATGGDDPTDHAATDHALAHHA